MQKITNYVLILCCISFIVSSCYAAVFIDTSFGTNGLSIISQGSGAYVNKIALQNDGKIIALGSCNLAQVPTAFLARFTSAGVLDTTFNSTGIVTLNYGSNIVANSFAVQTDGKIVITGYSTLDNSCRAIVVRYTNAGVLDETFGSGGFVAQLIGSNSMAYDVKIQTINSIPYLLIVGYAFVDQEGAVFIARYDMNGDLDETFGSAGIVTTHIASSPTPVVMHVLSDQKILIAGSVLDGNRKLLIAGYTSSGALDTDFGTQGVVVTSIPNSIDDAINDCLVQSDGKILVAGRSQIGGQGKMFVARYSALGVLDNAFGTAGVTVASLGSEAFISSLHIKADGKFIVGAAIDNVGVLLRFTSTGSLDTDFGVNGLITSPLSNSFGVFPVYLDALENILFGGSSGDNGVIARYRSTGADYIALQSPVDGATITDNTFAMTGRSSQANASVRVRIGGTIIGTATTDANGNWNAGTSPVIANGSKTLVAELMNGQSVVASATLGITINASDIITMTPASGSIIDSSTPIISGTSSRANQSVDIYIDGMLTATVGTDDVGTWTYLVDSALKNGEHAFVAKLLVNSSVVATATSTFTVASFSWSAQPECKNYRIVSGSFTTADTPPIILSGSGTACPPTCNFSVSKLSSSRFQINFLPKFLYTPLVIASLMKSSTSTGSVNLQSTATTTSAVINKSGVADQIYFMATSCLG